MKILDIALKDLFRSFRNGFGLVMMFAAPLLITGSLHFAFGGLWGDGDGSGFDLPVTRVQIVNLDRPDPQLGGFSAGQALVEFLQSEQLAGLLQVTEASDAASARAAVDDQKAGVAVIIPADLSAAVFDPDGSASVGVYHDPTLTLGPGIVENLVSQFVDGFAGTKIATSVVADQLGEHGLIVDAGTMRDVAVQYAAWAEAMGQSLGEGAHPALNIQPPPSEAEPVSQGATMMGGIMAGMMIFFTFFTGASSAETIIREDEEGTLARLFTTPTSRAAILGGKFTAAFFNLAVQVLVLLLASALIFGVHWGEPLAVTLVSFGLVVVAAGFGVMLMSFVKNTRQSGVVMGGVLTLTGMAGGLFTTGFQNLPAVYDTINLFTPHGWVLRGWKLVLAGGGVSDVLLPVAVTLGMGLAFFVVGALVFRKRFA
ncbi:MAG: ABC transporter permease [Chloroflexota bacterium]|nr:ABC transporter permease [Chloroflexota bacterium]